MSRMVIPTRIKIIPKKYFNAVNFGYEDATKTPVTIDNTITIHIIPNEFLSCELDSDFFDLVNTLINISDRNQREQMIIIAIGHITALKFKIYQKFINHAATEKIIIAGIPLYRPSLGGSQSFSDITGTKVK